jgi:hypothetical protein
MSKEKDLRRRYSGNEGKDFAARNLVKLKVDVANWKVLWQNPETGEYWKEYFPESELHGGGTPEFVKIEEEEARNEFISWWSFRKPDPSSGSHPPEKV